MKLEAAAIRLAGALRKLVELSQPDTLVAHVDQTLVAVSWKALRMSYLRAPVAVGPPGQGRVIASNVAVDDAWTVNPKTQEVVLARPGEILFIDTNFGRVVRKVAASGLRSGTFGAALDGEGKRALFTVARDISLDFAEYTVVSVDLATGSQTGTPVVGSAGELELVWDEPSRTWVIGNTGTGASWRWDGYGPAAKFNGPDIAIQQGRPVQSATFAAGAKGVIVSAVVKGTGGDSTLVNGRIGADGPAWSEPIALPGGSVLTARRHPAQALWACLAYEGAGQQIQIRDESGKVLASADVRPPILLNCLLWSESSPERLWGSGIRAVAAATTSEG